MADNLTDLEERRLLDLSLTNGTVYLALFTVAPDDAGAGGTEVTGGAYARQAIPFSAAAATDGSGVTSKANSATITFPTATAAWGTLVAFGVYDAATGGNMRWHRNMTSGEQRAPMAGDTYVVASGAVTFGLS